MVSVPAELRPMLPGLLGAVVLLLLARVVGGKKGVKASNALVLISGASQGIGEAVARLVVAKGGRVVLLARRLTLRSLHGVVRAARISQGKLEGVKASIDKAHGAGRVWVYPCDCSLPADVEKAAKAIKKDVGVPDVIVNNAGAGRWKYLPESDGDEIRSCFDAPPLAAALLTRAFLLDMLQRGRGSVVQVMSPAALVPFPGATAYNMARWALRGFSEALRGDVYGTGINVQDVWLGEVESEYFNNNPGSSERLPPGSKSITCDKAAKAVLRCIESGSSAVYEPWSLQPLFSWMPGVMAMWLGMNGKRIRDKYLLKTRKD